MGPFPAGARGPPCALGSKLTRLQSRGLADAELKRRIPGKWPAGPVAEALDEPKAAKRDEQRQLLREDAPDFERCDDEVGLGVSREVPRPACNLRGRIVDLSDIDADVATVRIHERQRLPGAPHAIGSASRRTLGLNTSKTNRAP